MASENQLRWFRGESFQMDETSRGANGSMEGMVGILKCSLPRNGNESIEFIWTGPHRHWDCSISHWGEASKASRCCSFTAWSTNHWIVLLGERRSLGSPGNILDSPLSCLFWTKEQFLSRARLKYERWEWSHAHYTCRLCRGPLYLYT